jgi:hypothetical protein
MLGRLLVILFIIIIIIYFIYDIKLNLLKDNKIKENLNNYNRKDKEEEDNKNIDLDIYNSSNNYNKDVPFTGVNYEREGESMSKNDKSYFEYKNSINLTRVGDKFTFNGEIDDEKTFFYIDLQSIHSMFLIEDSFVYLTPYYDQIETLPCSGAFSGTNNAECTVVSTVFDKVDVEPRRLITITGCKNVLVQDMCPLVLDNMSVFVKLYNADSFKLGKYNFKNGGQFLAIKYAFYDKNLFLGNRFTNDKQLLNAIGLNNTRSKESIFRDMDVKSIGLQLYDIEYSDNSKIIFNPIIKEEKEFEIHELDDPTSNRSIMVNSIDINGFPHGVNGQLYFDTTIDYIGCSESLVQALVNSLDTLNGADFIEGRTFLKLSKSVNLPILTFTTLDQNLNPTNVLEIGPDIYMKEDNITNFYNPRIIDSNYEDNQANNKNKDIIRMGLPFFYNYLIIFNDINKRMYRKLEYERPKFDSHKKINKINKIQEDKLKSEKNKKEIKESDVVCYKKSIYDKNRPVNVLRNEEGGLDVNISYKTIFNLDKIE